MTINLDGATSAIINVNVDTCAGAGCTFAPAANFLQDQTYASSSSRFGLAWVGYRRQGAVFEVYGPCGMDRAKAMVSRSSLQETNTT